MTIHLLKKSSDALALKTLAEIPAARSSAVILLSNSTDVPAIPGVPVYTVSDHPAGGAQDIGYPKLVEMIFAADKVITW
jgi:hypothetical protein